MTKFLPLVKKILANHRSWLIFAFLLTFYYVLMLNLGRDALFDWDEGIYGELGRQVVARGDFLTPYWNGDPWLEKPPGVAWVSGIGIALMGPTATGARLLMPLFAVYTLYIVYRLGSRLGSRTHGLIAAGVLASLNLFLGRTRAVNTDMALLASLTTTLLFLLENRPSWWVALSIFGGVWFKGIAGLLSIIVALPLLLSKSKTYLLSYLFYLLILILPWHIYAYIQHGDSFLTPYFFEQVLRRATAQIEFHFENRWYYFNYLWENLGLGVILVAGVGAASLLVTRKNLYILWWLVAPLTIFTLAKTRLFWYILPIYPAIALLVSEAIGKFQATPTAKRVVQILALGVLIQSIMATATSVEINKASADLPDRLSVVQSLSVLSSELAVLVPPSERLSEALLPEVAKLSSSFRYGGMPSVVYYFRGHVTFYYDVDRFREYWGSTETPLALIATEDLSLIPGPVHPVVTTPTYLGISKGLYAQR